MNNLQKRGLPHAHILWIVNANDKPRTPENFDKILSAEIPDPIDQSLAYSTVTKFMMHGPCEPLHPNAPCMRDGKCSKKCPHKFSDATIVESSGYTVYRQRNNGRNVVKGRGAQLDNRWAVLHSLFLCIKYDAHINVEICNTIQSVKYVYKYVYKGHDKASVNLVETTNTTGTAAQKNNRDETRGHLDTRFVPGSEACWRIFHFSLHEKFPSHQRLAIHLPDSQPVYFRATDNATDILARAMTKDTTLTC